MYILGSYVVSDFRCVGLDPALALMVLLSVTPATTVFEIISLMNAEVKMVLTYMTLLLCSYLQKYVRKQTKVFVFGGF